MHLRLLKKNSEAGFMPNSPQPIPRNWQPSGGLRPPPVSDGSKSLGASARIGRNSFARPPASPLRSDRSPAQNQNEWQPSGSPPRRGLSPSGDPTPDQTPHFSTKFFTENTTSRNVRRDANINGVQTSNSGAVSTPPDQTKRINPSKIDSKNPEEGDRTDEVRKKSMPFFSKIQKFPKNTWTYMKKNPRKSILIGSVVALFVILPLCIVVPQVYLIVVGIGVILGIIYTIKIAKTTPALYKAYKAKKSEKKP